MARRIDIVLETGELEELHDLKRDPDVIAIRELRSVHGIGPVKAAELIEKKGVKSLAALRRAVAGGEVHLDATQTIGLLHAEDFSMKIPRSEMVEHETLLNSAKLKHDNLEL